MVGSSPCGTLSYRQSLQAAGRCRRRERAETSLCCHALNGDIVTVGGGRSLGGRAVYVQQHIVHPQLPVLVSSTVAQCEGAAAGPLEAVSFTDTFRRSAAGDALRAVLTYCNLSLQRWTWSCTATYQSESRCETQIRNGLESITAQRELELSSRQADIEWHCDRGRSRHDRLFSLLVPLAATQQPQAHGESR